MSGEEFKQIFLPCSEQMFLLALRLTDSKADAEDVVQDVFAKLWQGRNGLKSVDNPRAYAIIMVRNRCLDLLASRRDYAPIESISEPAEEGVDDVLTEALSSLPEPHRSIMEMRYSQDFSMQEIESRTSLSQGNLRVILHRARLLLRKRFNRN